MIQTADRRRTASAPTFAYRGELVVGSSPVAGPSKAFLRGLRAIDDGVEIFWLDRLGRWALYRVKARGGTPADDLLVKEFVLTGPDGEFREPGPWLLDFMRRFDKTRGGSVDPLLATREYLNDLDRHDARIEAERGEADEEMVEALGADLFAYAVKETRHFVQPERSPCPTPTPSTDCPSHAGRKRSDPKRCERVDTQFSA